MAEIIELHTVNNWQYHYFPITGDFIKFKVQTPTDAQVILKTAPTDEGPYIEICIGGWANTRSIIRKDAPTHKVQFVSANLLHGNEFRGFWIWWEKGFIRVGRENEIEPFMSWKDEDFFDVKYVGVCTGRGAGGTWKLEMSPLCTLRSLPHKKLNDGKLRWERIVDSKLPRDAMIGGFEDEPTYIARAEHYRSLCPGKYVPSQKKAYVAWGGREYGKDDFEILCGYNAKWVKTGGNRIPENVFVAGTSEVRNEPLYIGRTMHNDYLVPGKVHVLYSTCYLPYRGLEVEAYQYEILVEPDVETRGIMGT